jgi:hypothetical protein
VAAQTAQKPDAVNEACRVQSKQHPKADLVHLDDRGLIVRNGHDQKVRRGEHRWEKQKDPLAPRSRESGSTFQARADTDTHTSLIRKGGKRIHRRSPRLEAIVSRDHRNAEDEAPRSPEGATEKWIELPRFA